MARPMRVTAAAAGATSPFILNQAGPSPFNVGIGCAISAGASLIYSVEYTFDDVFAPNYNPATGVWTALTAITAATTTKDGNIAYPVMAVRLNVTSYTSGSVTMTVIQANQ
jgi:hypothetical protein